MTGIVGKCWCNVALDNDESGTLQERPVSEPHNTLRCRTKVVRVLTSAEENRIRVAAAKRVASLTATSGRRLGEIAGAAHTPPLLSPVAQTGFEAAMPVSKVYPGDNNEPFPSCIEVNSSQHNFSQASCSFQETNAVLKCTEILPHSNQATKDLDSDNKPLFRDRRPPVAKARCKVSTDKEIYTDFAKTKDCPEIWQAFSSPSGNIFWHNSGM